MEQQPRPTPPADTAPRSERVTEALEHVCSLADRVTGACIGYKVDTYNSRGYGQLDFVPSDEATAQQACEKQGVSAVYDDMFYGNSSADLDGDRGEQYFQGVQIAAYQRTKEGAEFSILGQPATEKEFTDMISAAPRKLREVLKQNKPHVRYHGSEHTYGQLKEY